MGYSVAVDQPVTITHGIYDAGGTVLQTGESGNIGTELRDPDGATSVISVTVAEVGTTGLYTLTFTPDEIGNWHLEVTIGGGLTPAQAEYVVVSKTLAQVAVDSNLLLTTLARLQKRINTDQAAFDDLLNALISEVSHDMQHLMGRTIAETAYTWYLDGTGMERLLLPQGPLVSVTQIDSIEYGEGVAGARTETATELEQYQYLTEGLRSEGHRGRGALVRRDGLSFTAGLRNWKVQATCGFDTVPESLVSHANTHCAALFFGREAAGLSNKDKGDGGGIATIPMARLRDAMVRVCRPWKLHRF